MQWKKSAKHCNRWPIGPGWCTFDSNEETGFPQWNAARNARKIITHTVNVLVIEHRRLAHCIAEPLLLLAAV